MIEKRFKTVTLPLGVGSLEFSVPDRAHCLELADRQRVITSFLFSERFQEQLDKQKRDFSSITLAFDPKDMPKAKELIRDFRRNFAKEMDKSAAKRRSMEDSVAFGGTYELDTTKIVTRGNRSFIPLEFSGAPELFAEDVLEILNEFEHIRGVRVVSWKFATTQSDRTDGSWGDVEGLWVDHGIQ